MQALGAVLNLPNNWITFWGHMTSSVKWPLDLPTPNTLPYQTGSGSDDRLLRYIRSFLKTPSCRRRSAAGCRHTDKNCLTIRNINSKTRSFV